MRFDFWSWLVGIPTGIGVNWISQWLWRKLSKRRQSKGDYFTATYSTESIEFEGRIHSNISSEQILKNLVKPIVEPQKGQKDTGET